MPLKNNYSEDLELASLLVKIDVFPAKVTAAPGVLPGLQSYEVQGNH